MYPARFVSLKLPFLALAAATAKPPESRPPAPVPAYGEYCIRAVCNRFTRDNRHAGRYVAYARNYVIVEQVEAVCNARANKRRGDWCHPDVEVSFVPNMLHCSGLFFEFNGATKRLL